MPSGDVLPASVLAIALAAISPLTPAANKLPYFDSGTTATLADLTANARLLLADTDVPRLGTSNTWSGATNAFQAVTATTVSATKGSIGDVVTWQGGSKVGYLFSDNGYIGLGDAANGTGNGFLIGEGTPKIYALIAGSAVTTTQAGSFAVAGALSTTLGASIGNTSQSNQINLDSIASGTNGGASLNVKNGTATIIAIGNKSNVTGGAYDATPMLWGSADISTNVGMNITGALSAQSTSVTQGNFNGWSTLGGNNTFNGQIMVGALPYGLRISADPSAHGGCEMVNMFDAAHSFVRIGVRGYGTTVYPALFDSDGLTINGAIATTGNINAGGVVYAHRLDTSSSNVYGVWNSTTSGNAYLGLQSSSVTYGYLGSGAALLSPVGSSTEIVLRGESDIVFSRGASEIARLTSLGLSLVGNITGPGVVELTTGGVGTRLQSSSGDARGYAGTVTAHNFGLLRHGALKFEVTADGTYTYGNAGTNGNQFNTYASVDFEMVHRGTGGWQFFTDIGTRLPFTIARLAPTNTLVLSGSGNVLVGTGTDSGDKLRVDGTVSSSHSLRSTGLVVVDANTGSEPVTVDLSLGSIFKYYRGSNHTLTFTGPSGVRIVGIVVYAQIASGVTFTSISNGYEVGETSNVSVGAFGSVIIFSGIWDGLNFVYSKGQQASAVPSS
jgi:hypothetical protein